MILLPVAVFFFFTSLHDLWQPGGAEDETKEVCEEKLS